MRPSTILAIKKFVSRAIFVGVIGAAVAFIYVIYLPKQYLVVGKLVVFPSGLSSAQQNLGYEVGNTVAIINSSTFRTNTFQGLEKNFSSAVQAGSSSVVEISFLVQDDERSAAEDAISRVPMALADYTRDIYDGSPFKYRLLSDPETSSGPVKPNLTIYIAGGLGIGVLLYLLYWILFDFLRVPKTERQARVQKEMIEPVETPPVDFQPEEIVPEEEMPLEAYGIEAEETVSQLAKTTGAEKKKRSKLLVLLRIFPLRLPSLQLARKFQLLPLPNIRSPLMRK